MASNRDKSISEQIHQIKSQLVDKGYKLTQQREVTVRVLLEHEKDHFSAEEVFLLVKEKFPEIDSQPFIAHSSYSVTFRLLRRLTSAMGPLALICAAQTAPTITTT